jgi:hypothetical protein
MHTVLTSNTMLLDSKPLFGESNLVLVESVTNEIVFSKAAILCYKKANQKKGGN